VEKGTAAKEADQLYWQTDRSVADIAETLGVSRRALYELITPESSGIKCRKCQGDVVFSNRSAKISRIGRCTTCGDEQNAAADEIEEEETLTPYAAGWPRVVQRSFDEEVSGRAFRLGGVAIVGAALGAIAAFMIVRRR
jgi:hypothetical protein